MEVATFHGFAWRVVNDFGQIYGHPHPLPSSRAKSDRTSTRAHL